MRAVTHPISQKLPTAVLAIVLSSCLSASAGAAEWRHGLSYFGDLKYPADFAHFDYVNPNAPKGGKLSDVRVREALYLAYDFEWGNRALQYSEYDRVRSYFEGSDMSSAGTLPSEEELALLEPFRGQIPDRVFTHIYEIPRTKGIGRNRDQLIHASKLLDEAGWVVKDFKRVNSRTGELFTIDFLLKSVDEEKILMSFADSLTPLGIDSRIRIVESSQYRYRIRHYDFDDSGHTLNRTGWFDLWWIDPEKDARVKAGVGALRRSSAQGGG